MKNIVVIPTDKVEVFGQVIRAFTEQSLAFSVETTDKDFIITVTGY